ncbi:MAG: hypothetical protein AAF907_07330, partial [Planctomycetota bacterium]
MAALGGWASACGQSTYPTTAGPTIAAAAPDDVLQSARSSFTIPFAASPADLAAAGATEARLLVSTTRGDGWEVAARATPDQRGFSFVAPADGEYWF